MTPEKGSAERVRAGQEAVRAVRTAWARAGKQGMAVCAQSVVTCLGSVMFGIEKVEDEKVGGEGEVRRGGVMQKKEEKEKKEVVFSTRVGSEKINVLCDKLSWGRQWRMGRPSVVVLKRSNKALGYCRPIIIERSE